ncbi:MAG: lipid-A-disaccharide synthase [Planctomycetota bacterium]
MFLNQKNEFPFHVNIVYTLQLKTMIDTSGTYRVFISAAEPSADSHCAGLINALKSKADNIKFVGLGGDKMAKAGCQLIENTSSQAAMIYKAFSKIPRFYKLIRYTKQYLNNHKIDLVIVCDSPAFNFHIAKAARKAGIKTLFYVAPQLWAWASWRIHKLRKCCDKLACILPFEENWFKDRGIDAEFIGNPLVEEFAASLPSNQKSYASFTPEKATIALLPGSRNAEIESLWQHMQQVALKLKNKFPYLQITAVAVDADRKATLQRSSLEGFECSYTIGTVASTAFQVDLCLVASGSATLQVAAAGCPMVVMYQSSRILWHLLGRWLIKSKHLSLVNILAGKELVPEFMPYFKSTEPIAAVIEQMFYDPNNLSALSGDLIKLTEPLAARQASQRVSDIVIDML